MSPQLVLLSCCNVTTEVHSEWFSVRQRACCTLIWNGSEEPQTGNWQNEGFWELVTSVGFPCSSKNRNCVPLFSRWNKAMFVSCLSYFSSWAECTLGLFSNLSLLCLSFSVLPSHHCGHNIMTTSCCSSLVLLLHWTTDLGDTWIGCQPVRVVKATLKLQLCKVVKISVVPTAGRAGHSSQECLFWTFTLVKMKISSTCRKTWGAAIKKNNNLNKKGMKTLNISLSIAKNNL